MRNSILNFFLGICLLSVLLRLYMGGYATLWEDGVQISWLSVLLLWVPCYVASLIAWGCWLLRDLYVPSSISFHCFLTCSCSYLAWEVVVFLRPARETNISQTIRFITKHNPWRRIQDHHEWYVFHAGAFYSVTITVIIISGTLIVKRACTRGTKCF